MLEQVLGKHEEVKGPILNLVIEIAEYAPYPVLELIFRELSRIPLNLITETSISFICLYTINVLKNTQRKREEAKKLLKQLERSNPGKKVELPKELSEANFKLYDLDILWDVMTWSRNDMKIDPKLKDYAVNCVIKLAETGEDLAKSFLTKALDAIKENAGSAVRCMKFFMNCYKYLKKKWDLKRFVQKAVSKESGIIEIVMRNFVKYKDSVNKMCATQAELKNPMSFVCVFLPFLEVKYNLLYSRNLHIVGNMKNA